MAITTINVGLIANDGTGDDLREAFVKVNDNFDELDTNLQTLTAVSGENVGSGGYTVFKEKVGNNLQFRTLAIDPNSPSTMSLRVAEDGNTLYLASTQATYRITDGTFTLTSNVEQVLTMTGSGATNVTVSPSSRTITFDSSLSRETSPTLGGNLNASNNELRNVAAINTITRDQLNELFTFDFGSVGSTRISIIDWFINQQDIDFGTLTVPADEDVDLGLIAS